MKAGSRPFFCPHKNGTKVLVHPIGQFLLLGFPIFLMETPPIRILIAEDQADIRMALEAYVSFDPQMLLISSFANGLAAWDWFEANHDEIDVALLDIDMPGMNGIDLVGKIKGKNQQVQCLMCTVYEDNDRIFKALEAGASGYILKKSAANQILQAIRDIHFGGAPMSSEIARRVVQSFSQKRKAVDPSTFSLSNREMEILKLLEKGFLYKEIAAQLFISVETVRRHVHNIYEKLHVGNRTEAINKISGKTL
jgi:DNA-binding NarL/FixJ family response regulator